MSSFMLLSPPLTMTTSSLASSTIATALSTAACAISNSPLASPARCSSEFAVKRISTLRPWRSKMPCDAADRAGSACAPGNILTLSAVCAAVTLQTKNNSNGTMRIISAPPLAARLSSPLRRKRHAAGTYSRPFQIRRARSRAPRGVHRPGHFRARDAAHPRARVDLLRAREPGAEGRRLLHGADRPPADADGAWRRRQSERALQPLPAPRQHDVRRPQGQRRRFLPLLVPRLDVPARRQSAVDPDDGIRLRRHALRQGQSRLQHEARRARRELSRLP